MPQTRPLAVHSKAVVARGVGDVSETDPGLLARCEVRHPDVRQRRVIASSVVLHVVVKTVVDDAVGHAVVVLDGVVGVVVWQQALHGLPTVAVADTSAAPTRAGPEVPFLRGSTA